MPRPSRREKKLANLQCNSCEHQFRAPAWHVTITASDIPDPIGWVPEANTGARCPACGSRAVGVRDY